MSVVKYAEKKVGGLRTDVRGQKTEDRGLRTEVGGQRFEGTPVKCASLSFGISLGKEVGGSVEGSRVQEESA